jgi:L-amino acid N-acyltransferase YncA
MIRSANLQDAQAICDIYNYYVLHTHINFEEEAVAVHDMEQRIFTIIQKLPWIVFEEEGKILGYAYASEWKSRRSYRFSVESTVYLKNGNQRKGIGSTLYTALFEALKGTNIHAVIGGVAQPNEGSNTLHEKFGFEKVAHFKEVGYKLNQWIDVAYWEKILT